MFSDKLFKIPIVYNFLIRMEKCECGSTEFEMDSIRGDKICGSCGRIMEGISLVNELAFDNSNVHGKFGSKSGNYTQIKARFSNFSSF